MKTKLLTYAGAGLTSLTLLWLASQYLRWRNPQIVLPQTQIESAFEAVSEAEQAEALQQEQAAQDAVFQSELSASHAAVKSALADWNRNGDAALVCARSQTLYTKMVGIADQTKRPLEVVYRDELAGHVSRLQQWQQQSHAGVTGDSAAIADARAMVGDTQAFLALGDLLFSKASAPLCDNRLDSEIAQLGMVYSEVAARIDTRDEYLREVEADSLARANNWWQEQQAERDRVQTHLGGDANGN